MFTIYKVILREWVKFSSDFIIWSHMTAILSTLVLRSYELVMGGWPTPFPEHTVAEAYSKISGLSKWSWFSPVLNFFARWKSSFIVWLICKWTILDNHLPCYTVTLEINTLSVHNLRAKWRQKIEKKKSVDGLLA